MTGSANYGTYESTEEELDTFLRHSIKPFMKRRLNELDSLRAKNEHLQHALMCAETDRDHAIAELDAAIKGRNTWHDKAQEYRRQSVEYRDSRDKWCEAAVREQLAAEDALPRVITADELKLGSGQWIAYRSHTHEDLWFAEKYDKDAFSPGYKGTVVLLADAPEEEAEPERRGVVVHAIRKGDVYDLWDEPGALIVDGRTAEREYTADNFHLDDEIRLVFRPAPERTADYCSHCMTTHPSS